MPKIVVLGSTGMLGREVARTGFPGYDLMEVNRRSHPVENSNEHIQVDSNFSELEKRMNLNEIDYVINCAGLIRQKIDERVPVSRKEALHANFEIPLQLVRLSEEYGFRIIQIGTDCVFSGQKGNYLESDLHDATDVYGKSKSLGEIPHENLSILRTSIVGLEMNSNSSLLSWLITQPTNAIVNGYTDQIWNGVTVMHFAKLVSNIICHDKFDLFSGVHHVVPADKITKESLIKIFAKVFNRGDLQIRSELSGRKADMSLSTSDPDLNNYLWKIAGYSQPPSIEEMILEYSYGIRSGG